ncbi:cryptochrome/photolyase family protein [Roseomonas sp. BN140053]|uniref:cryptochrome/photolyase family protein n=1 Tax=Roseomonas sp. BN140053 TaxID=3391898 RepID=UPI0039EA8393
MTTAAHIVWFRQDLRLSDNPALAAAGDAPVLPVFVLDDAAAGRWATGGAARWWLHHSLDALGRALAERGAPLILLRGDTTTLLPELAARSGAAAVQAGQLPEPWARRQADAVAAALARDGRALHLHRSTTLRDPKELRAGSGNPYSVFAPFARKLLAGGDPAPPIPAPARLHGAPSPISSLPLAALDLLPRPPVPDWAAEFGTVWTPGEAGAQERLHRFVGTGLGHYAQRRNDPAIEGSSGLSPHLRWGEVSPRQVWHAAVAAMGGDRTRAEPFLREVIWREFSGYLLWHRPEMPEHALRPSFERFPFAPDATLLAAWQRGRTGYPIVDAGLHQLWRVGWMHNRVRLIAASLLVKHLLQPWQDGAAWFWDTLVDADLGNNSASWQWIAGAGTDAAPYFRVFNPATQARKFDPEGTYVRRWVPELRKLPTAFIHAPWEAPEPALRAAGVRLGDTYPRPIVDHATGRARALAALRTLRLPPAEAEAP